MHPLNHRDLNELTPVYVDFETHFAPDFNLRKMNQVLYIRDPRFHVHGVGIATGDHPIHFYAGLDIAEALDSIDWDNSVLVGHRLLFDGAILFEHYGHRPAAYADTLYAALALVPLGFKHDLDTVARMMGHSGKIGGVLDKIKGVRYPSIELLTELGEYCKEDVSATRFIYKKLRPALPANQWELFSVTSRLGIESPLELDAEVLERELATTIDRRANKIDDSGHDISVLSSNPQFFALLKTLVKPEDLPVKINKNGEETPALAKNDAQWVKFRLKYPDLAPLFDAREQSKSTIGVTRATTFLHIARTPRGTLPMGYRAWGAHTGRPSGDLGLNVMNLPRKDKSELRRAILAPEGHVINVSDSAQIELRAQLWFSGDTVLLNKLARDEDIYSEVATEMYGRPITKANPLERGVGKATELGGQYGMGGPRYRAYLAGGPLGLPPVFKSEHEAQEAINIYRLGHVPTTTMWARLNKIIQKMLKKDCDEKIGPLIFRHQHVLLPNGTTLQYNDLRALDDDEGYAYGENGKISFLWGGSFLENLIQALANIIVLEQAMEIDRRIARVVGWTYDEVLAISLEEDAEEVQQAMYKIMSTPPAWAPDLPLAAEGGYDRRYIK